MTKAKVGDLVRILPNTWAVNNGYAHAEEITEVVDVFTDDSGVVVNTSTRKSVPVEEKEYEIYLKAGEEKTKENQGVDSNMGLKAEDLSVGMSIAFSSLMYVETCDWNVEVDVPYKITEIDNEGDVYLDLTDAIGDYFFISENELVDACIVLEYNNLPEIPLLDLTGRLLPPEPEFKLIDPTFDIIDMLELLAKYYDSIPSGLMMELINMNRILEDAHEN